jgi:hypothetical protein
VAQPVILATQEAEIRRITLLNQRRQILRETLTPENPSQKRAGGVAQDVGPEFKPQCHKKKKKNPPLSQDKITLPYYS